MTDKTNSWCKQLRLLADVANTQPHATYTAFIHGFLHKFTYLCRTNEDIDHLLQPLDEVIRLRLIPAWTGPAPPSVSERELFALPNRLGGLGFINPAKCSSIEFPASIKISSPMSHLMESQHSEYTLEALEAQMLAKQEVRKERRERSLASQTP